MKRTEKINKENKTIRLLGVRVDDLPLETLLQKITEIVSLRERAIISNVNVQAMNIAYEQAWFKEFLNQSNYVFCDGFGIWLGGLLAGRRLHHRYTPPDWIDQLVAAGNGQLTFYFLGARPGIAERAGIRLQEQLPDFKLLGTHHGYFNKRKTRPKTVK